MKVLVIGANGKTATRIVSLIKKETAHEPLAMIRSTTQRAKFDNLGVATVLADLEYPIDHAIFLNTFFHSTIFPTKPVCMQFFNLSSSLYNCNASNKTCNQQGFYFLN
ncbi:MAG: hypothetical protein VXZ92_12260, partial [SAR324 cluster bacterium]|nr:hypothetical protein [SAR324 cluster bacterium]